jgi:hypothetical protein
LNRIPTSFNTQTSSTQAHKPEEASHATIFSRGKGFGSKLFFSLKNLFSRTDKSSASAAVTKAVPQATIDSIKTENKKGDSVELTPRVRVRMEYRQLLDLEASKAKGQSGGVDASKAKGKSYEVKVSMFDSAVAKLQRGDELKDWDKKTLDEVLPKLKTAVEENEKLDESMRKKLLSDISDIRRDFTELQLKSAVKAAWQRSE